MTSVRAIAWISGLALACGSAKERRAAPPPRPPYLQIVYDLDLAKAVDDRTRAVRAELEAHLADRGIAAAVTQSVTQPDTVMVTPTDPASRLGIFEVARRSYRDVIEARVCPPPVSPPSLCFGITARHAAAIEAAALEAAVATLRERIDAADVVEPSVTARGRQIVVECQHDAAAVDAMKSLLVRTGVLEFKGVDEDSAFMRALIARADEDPAAAAAGIAYAVDSWDDPGGNTHVDGYLIGPDRGVLERYLHGLAQAEPRFAVPDDRAIGYQQVESRWRTYYLERHAAVTGTAIASAALSYGPGAGPQIEVELDRDGRIAFDELTTRLVGHKVAVILDDRVASAPIITGRIGGGRASITMGAGTYAEQVAEAQELIVVLRTGSLPAPLREVSSTIGP